MRRWIAALAAEQIGNNQTLFQDPALWYWNGSHRCNRAWAWNGILHKGRDNARTPVQWDSTDNAGFTTGTPWIQVNPNYKQINVENATEDPDSILHHYRKLIALRKGNDILKYGDFEMLHPSHEKLFIYRREYGADSVIVCCNFANEQITLPQDISGTIILGSLHTKDMLGPYGFAVFSSQKPEL